MPGVAAKTPTRPAAEKCQVAIGHAFLERLNADDVVEICQQLRAQHHIASRDIADVLIGFRGSRGRFDDPLLFRYVNTLWQKKFIDTSDLLLALLKHTEYGTKASRIAAARHRRTLGIPSCEERVFAILAQNHLTSELPPSAWKSHDLLYAITRWMRIISEHEMGLQLENGGMHGLTPSHYGMYETLGTLALTILGNPGMRNLTQQPWWKKRRAIVASEMENFDTHVLQWMQSPLAGRLRGLASLPPFIATNDKGQPVFTDQQILSTISDVPIVHSRAGLFIWLNASLTGRPLTEDMSMLAYLHGRYGTDSQAMIVDLLVACFDVLTNAMLRKESRQTVKGIRSFICNKVPILLTMLSGTVAPPMTIEAFVQMAFMSEGMIPMEPLAPLTPGATDIRDILKVARLEFLQACGLHGLISETAIATILQEPAIALPRISRYTKDGLLAQCANNISRLDVHIEDLGSMQGNVGAICGCIVDTLSNLCINKDAMSLKSVCLELIKNIPNLDIIMQYTQPGMLLLPICTLLSDWIHDQDQTEFAPAYEEFATILLFVLAVIHRFDLDPSEVGLMADNFVTRLIDEMCVSTQPSELPEEQAAQLARWIEGLYAVDDHGETSGIGDDVMSQCSPQSFYLLVPSLFEQSVIACRSNALQMKTFNGGLELLLEPFLLPSSIIGLKWLGQHAWEDHNDTDIVLQALDKLLKAPSSSQDTLAMHRAILSIVATPLSDSLHELVRKRPDKKMASELLNLLKPHLHHQRTFKCSKAELDELIQTDGSLQRRLENGIRNLITWASNSSNPPNPPPKYSHKEFAVACQTLDADVILETILSELRQNSFNMSVALDISTAIICAPTADSIGVQTANARNDPTSKLRNHVRLQGSDVQNMLNKPQSYAEALARLSRRIETQLAMPQMPPIAMPIQIQEQAADQMMHDLGLGGLAGDISGANVEGAGNADLTGLDPSLDLSGASAQELADIAAVDTDSMQLDQSQMFGGLDLSLDQSQAQQVDALQNQEEDIFAGLDMNMGDLGEDFNFM